MSDKLRIVKVNNPFQPRDREIREVDHRPGAALADYIDDRAEDLVIAHNGRIVSAEKISEIIPRPGDSIALCPRVAGGGDTGKNVAQILAMIALTVVTFGVGSVVAGGAFIGQGFLAPLYWGWGSFVAATLTSVAGAYLINTLFPAPQPGTDIDTPKPVWGSLVPVDRQGSVVGMTYGTIRTGGTILQRRIVLDGDKQYVYYLASGGEEVEEISGIKLGDQPIENYRDVLVDVRMGTNDQTAIPGFDDTYQTQALSYELDESWRIHQTEGDDGTGLEVIIECPLGLYYRQDDGDLSNASVTMAVEYRKVGDLDWTSWTPRRILQDNSAYKYDTYQISIHGDRSSELTVDLDIEMLIKNAQVISARITDIEVITVFFKEYTIITIDVAVPDNIYAIRWQSIATWTITAAEASPVRRVYRKTGLPAGQYEVRIACIHKSGTGDNYATDVYWTALSHIVEDNFRRPGKNLVGIRALATDQLSGAFPAVTWLQTRNSVWVWDPALSQYVQKPAYNPAWAAYDLIHQARRVKNVHTGLYEFIVRGYPADRILYQEFADWAAFCTANDLRVDYCFDQEMTLWDALKIPGGCGRGQAILRGTRWGAVYDAPADPVQLFTVGNIGEDSFEEQFLSTMDRAQALEITYQDQELDYEKQTLIVYPEGWDTSQIVTSPARIDLPGCTRRSQAYKEAIYRLRLLRLVRVVSWTADVDALACQVGDVVALAHDVPQWGYSGRLAADATANTLILDRKVTLEPGLSYAVMIRMADDTLIQKVVQGVSEPTETDTLTVTVSFDTDTEPAAYVDGTHLTVTGDRIADYPAGRPVVLIHADAEREVVVIGSIYNSGTGLTTVEVTGPVEPDLEFVRYRFTMPRRFDVYSFGRMGVEVKPFRLLNIARSGDLQFRLTGLEYDPTIYDPVGDAPPIQYSDLVPAVTGIRVSESVDASGYVWIHIGWTPPRDRYNGARVLIDGKQVGRVPASQTRFDYMLRSFAPITIKIVAIDFDGNDFGEAETTYTPQGDIYPPAAPTGLVVESIQGGFSIKFDKPPEYDWSRAEVFASLDRNPASFSRPSVAYLSDGTQVAAGQPRFETGKFGQAVMVEEGTTNLFLNPSFENDLTNWNGWGSPPTREVVTTQKLYGSKALHLITNGNNQGVFQSFTVSLGVPYTLSVWVKVITGLPVIMVGRDGTYSTAVAPAEWTGDGQWHRLTLTFTASTATNINIYLGKSAAGATGEYYFDAVQLEAKPYATSFTDSTRSPESLTIPTAGVLNPQEGTVECWVKLLRTPGANEQVLFDGAGPANQNLQVVVRTDGKLEARYGTGAATVTITGTTVLAADAWYAVAVRWSSAGVALFLNGTSEASSATAPGLSFGANAYLGSDAAGANQLDGLLDSLRISNRARADEEIATAYTSEQPLAPDANTTGLWQFDGGLDNDKILLVAIASGHQTYFEIMVPKPGETYYVQVQHVDWAGNRSPMSEMKEVVAGQYQGTSLAPATVPYGALDPLMTELLKAIIVDPCVLSGWQLPKDQNIILDLPADKDQCWYRHNDPIWKVAVADYLHVGYRLYDPDTIIMTRFAIKFNLAGVIGTVLNAKILLYCIDFTRNPSYPDSPFSLYKLTSAFNEENATQPTFDETPLFTPPLPTVKNSMYQITNSALIPVIQGWINNPSTNYGFMIRKESWTQDDWDTFISRHNSDPAKRPILRLTIRPPAQDLLVRVTSGSGYINGKLVHTNETLSTDLTGHPDGVYYIIVIYDPDLNVIIDHLSHAVLSEAAAIGDNHVHVDAVPADWAAGKLIHIGNERHKILSINGTTVNLDGTTLAAGYAAGTLVSLATPPETGMILGTVTKSGTTLTYDMSPRTGRKDLALSFSKFGVINQPDSSSPPGGHIWISNWLYVTINNYYEFTHNLDSYDIIVWAEFRDTSTGIIRLATPGHIGTETWLEYGLTIRKMSKNIIRINTGKACVHTDMNVGGHQDFSSGYIRLFVQRIL